MRPCERDQNLPVGWQGGGEFFYEINKEPGERKIQRKTERGDGDNRAADAVTKRDYQNARAQSISVTAAALRIETP